MLENKQDKLYHKLRQIIAYDKIDCGYYKPMVSELKYCEKIKLWRYYRGKLCSWERSKRKIRIRKTRYSERKIIEEQLNDR